MMHTRMGALRTDSDVAALVSSRLLARNAVSRSFFAREAPRLAAACEQMARRFLDGGRLLAFGRGPYATDAQHIAVEFIHPVLVGKRALPAVDLSCGFTEAIPVLTTPSDIVAGFCGPDGDAFVERSLRQARALGALTLALPGQHGDLNIDAPSPDPFIAQEMIEILYHTLWETVHVFFEHRARGHADVGAAAFLYPYLGDETQNTVALVDEVAASIAGKAREDERLREAIAATQSAVISDVISDVARRLGRGGTLFLFGNGGSATDANDWAIDCLGATSGRRVRALSLSAEPAVLTALANDIGTDALFMRQLEAFGREGDVAVAISTSGGSANVISGLAAARRRGMLTVALLGYDGGEIARRGLADHAIVVPSDHIPRIQEAQASIYHVMTETWQRWE